MTPIRLLPVVEAELQATARYYEAASPGLGRAFLAEVRRSLHQIATSTGAARIERGEVGVRRVARFPCRVYYRARLDETLVIAIGHRSSAAQTRFLATPLIRSPEGEPAAMLVSTTP
jgi:plasmid stabilization system protein ParE